MLKTVLEDSNDDVQLSNIVDQYEIDIKQETFENLGICKNCYNSIYENVSGCFQEYLNKIPTLLAEKIKEDLSIYLYSHIKLQSAQNPTKTFRNFDRFLNWQISRHQ